MALNTRQESKQAGRFGLIGLLNTLLDFGIYNVGLGILGLGAIPANFVSTTVAMSFSFLANKSFVFDAASKRVFKQAALFLLVTAFGLYVLQNGAIYLLLNVWRWPLETAYALVALFGLDSVFSREFIINNGAKLLATIVSLVWNYLLYRNVVFNSERAGVIDVLGDWLSEHRRALIVGGIVLTAAVFRLYRLDVLPPGLHPDEAANGLDVFSILNGDLQPFYERNGGREGLFFYLQAASVAVFGNTMLALRLVPAVIGTLGVVFSYAAFKEWFSPRVGLIAAVLMAVAPWAVQMSRLGFRASLLMLFVPLIMWAIARALKTGQARWFITTGVIFGLGFYTYISWRITPLIIIAITTFAVIRYRRELKRRWQPLLIIALSAVLTLLPLGYYAVRQPDVFFGRSGDVSIFNPAYNNGSVLRTAGSVAIKTAGMFHFSGDHNFRHNLGGAPQLDAFSGILFGLGLLLALRRIRDIRYFALLAMFGGFLIPELATAEGIPHALRAIGVVPVVYGLAAIGLIELWQRWRGVFPRNPAAYNLALFLLVISGFLAGVYNFQRYFVAWANAPETYVAHNEELYRTAQYLLSNSSEGQAYVAVDGYNDMSIAYLTTGKTTYRRLELGQVGGLKLKANERLIIPRYQGAAELPVPKSLDCEGHTSPSRPQTVVFTVCGP